MEFTVTHSFNCMTGFEANRLIDCRINKLESAGDKAKHQIKEARDAQGYVNTGQLCFGEYHGAAVIYGETAKEALENGDLFTSRSRNECSVEWSPATGVRSVHVLLTSAGCEREAAAETTVLAQLCGNARLP